MYRIRYALLRLGVRIFFPGIAKNLEEERVFETRIRTDSAEEVDRDLYISVEDNGAPVTVICFAGMAVLYAAMPRFEFRNTLLESGENFNFIWVRDPHRAWYRRAPDGSGRGYAFYTQILGEALAELGSDHVVAIGASAGGASAFLFSAALPINHVIAFNPVFPLEVYCSRESRRRVLFNFRKMFSHFNEYFESVLVTFGTAFIWKRSENLPGYEETPDTLTAWRKGNAPERTTVFYSTGNRPDADQAQPLRNIDGIRLVPVTSGRHNCMAELKAQGRLGKTILQEIQSGLSS